jgi:hypothetical protein
MPEGTSFCDEVMAAAVKIPGLWPAQTPATYGIALDSGRPTAETVTDLVEALSNRWRISDVTHPDRTRASLQIRSDIDMTCSVHITHRPERGTAPKTP